ncbi:MAG TPA: hypothetical protein VEP90_21775 [Methylomirabilota bacterium]|nr:hypothetical protein [Methylomirabilota bacterium]
MAVTPKKNKSGPPAYTDYTQFPGPYSMNTRSTKNPRLTKGKSTPKPKKSGTNPGM